MNQFAIVTGESLAKGACSVEPGLKLIVDMVESLLGRKWLV